MKKIKLNSETKHFGKIADNTKVETVGIVKIYADKIGDNCTFVHDGVLILEVKEMGADIKIKGEKDVFLMTGMMGKHMVFSSNGIVSVEAKRWARGVKFSNTSTAFVKTEVLADVAFENAGSVKVDAKTFRGACFFQQKSNFSSNVEHIVGEMYFLQKEDGIYLGNLKTIAPNAKVVFKTATLGIPEIECICGDVAIYASSIVHLSKLKNLSKNIRIRSAKSLEIPEIESIDDDAIIKVKNAITMTKGEETKKIRYQGEEIVVQNIDRIPTIMMNSKRKGEFKITRAKMLKGGKLESMKKCWVAQRGELFAHGDSIKEAIVDVNFKWARTDEGIKELVEAVNIKKTMNAREYRILTGSCQTGTQDFLKENGITWEEEVPIAKVVEITQKRFGHEKILKMFPAEVSL